MSFCARLVLDWPIVQFKNSEDSMSDANDAGANAAARNLDAFTASTGQPLTGTVHLDLHFETCRPEYEEALNRAGLRRGWHVLDAGCGSGAFLPLIDQRVAPTGRITAMDLAPDNIEVVKERLAVSPVSCPVELQVGSIADLPFPDNQFDAVWVANVLMYLSDRELEAAMRECLRVIRPGGVLAVKEADLTFPLLHPGPRLAYPHLIYGEYERIRRELGDDEGHLMIGAFRSRETRHWMERAGYVDVDQSYVVIERWAPLNEIERSFFTGVLKTGAESAEQLDLPEEDQAFWREQGDPESPGYLLNLPDFYWSQGHAVAVGRAPLTA
jgi:SAM-dependent methyltransferase